MFRFATVRRLLRTSSPRAKVGNRVWTACFENTSSVNRAGHDNAAELVSSGIQSGPVKPTTRQRALWTFAPIAIGLLTPSLIIFCLEVFVAHTPPLTATGHILHRQFAAGHNLFLLAVFGLIPFATLSTICAIAAKKLSPQRLACLGIGGLIGILGLMIPAHVAVWYPLYGPGHMSSTAVIAFVFIPIYCLGTMAVGLAIGWLVSLLPQFKTATATTDPDKAR